MPKFNCDTLRTIVRNMDDCDESFNQRWTPEELVRIGMAFLLCGWDIYPDRWTERQITEALQGIEPKWDRNEQPLYGNYVASTIRWPAADPGSLPPNVVERHGFSGYWEIVDSTNT